MKSNQIGIFLTTFFNSGILVLLSTANFSEHKIPILSSFLKDGAYTDFHSAWYDQVGSIIISTVLIGSLGPLFEFIGSYLLIKGLKIYDKIGLQRGQFTKKKSIQQYIDTFLGPEIELHSTHSNILNTIFVCMMYGTALPILYPISLLNFVISYLVERLQAFYFNRQPPAFDHKITLNALKILPFAALIHMFMTSYFLTNQQIFNNLVFPRQTVNDPIISGHFFKISLFTSPWNLGYPPLIMFWFFLLLVPVGVFSMYLIEKCAPQMLLSKMAK